MTSICKQKAAVRALATIVLLYGLMGIVLTLRHTLHLRGHRSVDELLLTVPIFVNMSYVYFSMLLFRQKRNAWLIVVFASVSLIGIDIVALLRRMDEGGAVALWQLWLRLSLIVCLLAALLYFRKLFLVRSDQQSFRRAVMLSVVVLGLTVLYGTIGFSLLDRHDFHQSIGLITAMDQTVDQFGLTAPTVVAHSLRARVFIDSLSLVSTSAVLYTLLAFFQPVRMRFRSQRKHRDIAERLLNHYPAEADDFFKLWPHDKHYFFHTNLTAGLAYHVARGVALVAGDPFGDSQYFDELLVAFEDVCFVNDWRVAFIHVSKKYVDLYKKHGLQLQKIGEDAVLDLKAAQSLSAGKKGKYFREITNRFTKQGYSVELIAPPFSLDVLRQTREISNDWLQQPGKAERGFMMGYYTPEYIQKSQLTVVRSADGTIQAFMNLVPTYQTGCANYDMLRVRASAPGNCSDFLLLGAIEALFAAQYTALNLGLSPLKGLSVSSEAGGFIDTALRFIYANGDKLYSFSGLQRFKQKYQPHWDERYIAYSGGVGGFAKVLPALTRAMKVK